VFSLHANFLCHFFPFKRFRVIWTQYLDFYPFSPPRAPPSPRFSCFCPCLAAVNSFMTLPHSVLVRFAFRRHSDSVHLLRPLFCHSTPPFLVFHSRCILLAVCLDFFSPLCLRLSSTCSIMDFAPPHFARHFFPFFQKPLHAAPPGFDSSSKKVPTWSSPLLRRSPLTFFSPMRRLVPRLGFPPQLQSPYHPAFLLIPSLCFHS